ncbi:M23 family metallopeptidase [Maritimibacter dapengensis]|uniref:M23 family metallopeptidase n=1 Tax=Maritimibacter dapengensis TaxID=2836868 RepID=A0ABS6T383_9RHOB|nr:M23 family metallopeptidase [Maritimibacter dapengensis]MBV7379589.1 M23 family metallopeptidase [Maritimibacter dapengensis]
MRLFWALCGMAFGLTACVQHEYGTAVAYLRHVHPKYEVVMPASAPPISQQFMYEKAGGGPGHRGLDVAASAGTPVLAAAPGRVTISMYEPAYGNRVVIEHGPDDTGRKVQTLYFHLDKRQVEIGQMVARGQQIGTLGETGLLSSFPHLHFEYHRETAPGARTKSGNNWWQGIEQLDPNAFWVNGPGRVTCAPVDRAPAHKITYPVVCRRNQS